MWSCCDSSTSIHDTHAPGAVKDEVEAGQARVHGARLAAARRVAGGAKVHSRLALELVAGLRQEAGHRLLTLLLPLLPALRVRGSDVLLEVPLPSVHEEVCLEGAG